MPVDAWITLVVLIGTVGLLITEKLPPAFLIAGSVLLLLLAGVIDEFEALSGFSNPAPATVAALYVLAGAFEATGGLDAVTDRMLGRSAAPDGGKLATRGELARLTVPAALASAFIANTPVVAMAAPRVSAWARRTGRQPSSYLMPLSFAAILGGVVTTIGTSTNLVVSGLLEEAGMDPLGIFEISAVGLPVALAGLAVLILLYPKLMPQRTGAYDRFTTSAREFTVEMIVQPSGPVAGRTVASAGLRNLAGVYLVEVERNGEVIGPVDPELVLESGDRLIFAGNIGKVLDLMRMRGLIPAEERHFSLEANDARRFFEVVVSADSALIGSTLKQVGFRSRYGAAVLALHRAGESVRSKLGAVPLRPGDVLLVLSDPGFGHRWGEGGDFSVVSAVGGTGPVRSHKSRTVQLIAAGMVLLAATGVLSLLQAALLAVAALLLFRVITPAEAHRAVDLHVILLIGASFGLAHAVSGSGLATAIAGGLAGALEGVGDVGLLAGLLVATMALTSMISNNAAAALMFPLGLAVAAGAGIDPRPVAIAVMIGASTDFLTPVGYQTNTMIYGMGGYRFSDFPRLGAPVTLVVVAVSLLVIPAVWPLR